VIQVYPNVRELAVDVSICGSDKVPIYRIDLVAI